MLFTSALVLLALSAVGALGLYDAESIAGLALLIGLLLLLLAFLKGRDAAGRGMPGPPTRS